MSDFFTQISIDSPASAVLMTGAALFCGLIIMLVYRLGEEKPSKHMMISALIVPAIVEAVIMAVNGSIGAGVAAAGAFSLVRFRSLPGSSQDICILFFAMSVGLVTGMGFAGYAVIFTVGLGIVIVIAEKIISPKSSGLMRQLKIIIPEDMDYCGVFDDIFKEYTASASLIRVKTVRMGTMYELVYNVVYKNVASEKDMLDKIRCRNGNLTVSSEIMPDLKEEL
ncbi:MAG: DUF4956 domain-containing protein [Oscillospiraceae bacterium]